MPDPFDKIEKLGNSLIQHGPSNSRIYLMKADERDLPSLPEELEALALKDGYTKIFAKVPERMRSDFEEYGYDQEASIPKFYRGDEDASFLGRYLSEDRMVEKEPDLVEDVLKVAQEKARPEIELATLPDGYGLTELGPDEAGMMSELYRTVFESYPFPIHDPGYLRETMQTHIRYFGVLAGDRLLAVSSAEMDRQGRNAEMTDFATHPDARGQGLALYLLAEMEQAMRGEKILTPYTIARAYSHGMNITFARAGYLYGGTLTNNTQISGRIESMNVWYKHLSG